MEKGEAEGRPHVPANLGFFDLSLNGNFKRKNADLVCVLVVHYDFKNDAEYFRDGDSNDVQNLRQAFEENRKCTFRDLLSPKKEVLLEILASEDKLVRLFSLGSLPSVFILYVLSHGKTGGKIFTDHWDKSSNNYSHFTTGDVFQSLSKLKGFKNCLKFINFGPCRGYLDDSIYTAEEIDPKFDLNDDNRDSCRITFFPKMHNLVILYSTVETTSANRNLSGSYLVNVMCDLLNSIGDDTPLLVFLTKLKFRIHHRSRSNNSAIKGRCKGQTPEIKMFSQNANFTISALKKQKVANEDEYFTWHSDDGSAIRGRRSVIFCNSFDEPVRELHEALSQNLSFETSLRKLNENNLNLYFQEATEFASGLGCILTCLFGQVFEHEENNAVCISVNGTKVAIGDIIHKLIGPKNDKWIGKPKLLFVIHQKVESSDFAHLPSVESEQIKSTKHNGWMVFILRDENLVQRFIQIFKGKHLKEGQSLQELLSPLLVEQAGVDKVMLNSTLQYLLDFPDWPRCFVKPKFRFKRADDYYFKRIGYEDVIEEARNVNECRIWLLSSVAGAGKSTVLQEVAHDLGKLLPNVKMLRVSLSKMYPYLLEHAFPRVEQFLAKAAQCLPEEISSLLVARKLIVFIDGFDEICSKCHKTVIRFFKILNERNVSVWISSRPQEAKVIEEKVGRLVKLDILPFDNSQQVELLHQLTQKNETDIQQFILNFEKKDVLENPLHLTLVTHFKSTNESNLYTIYDEVVRQKVAECLEEKDGYNRSHSKFKHHMSKALQNLQSVAFLYVRKMELREACKKKDLDRLSEIGLANEFSGRVTFLHQTFAEFLATQRFVSDLLKSGDSDLEIFDEDLSLAQCRKFADTFYSTIKDEETLELHTGRLLTYVKNDLERRLQIICCENLSQIFSMLKPHIKIREIDATARLTILCDTIRNENIAVQLLDMGAITNDQQLSENLSEILEQSAIHNSTGFFIRLKELFPNLPTMIRSQRDDIDAGFRAVEHGQYQILDLLLENGVDANFAMIQDNHWTPKCTLHVACERGFVACVEVLLKHGASLQLSTGMSALHVAAENGHLELTKFLALGKDEMKLTDVTTNNKYGWNAMHYAASTGCVEVAEFLDSINCQLVNKKNNDGETPLQLAVNRNRLEMCQWLVQEACVDVNAVDKEGKTVLHDLHKKKRVEASEWKMCTYLLTLGVDLEIRDNKGKTALHYAVLGHLELVQRLVDQGANLRAKNESGWNAMHISCYNGALAVTKFLHAKCGDLVQEKNEYGQTMLHVAIGTYSYNIDLIYWLVEEAGVDVDASDQNGRSALFVACMRNQWDTVNYLLSKNVNVHTKDTTGKTALHCAAQFGRLNEVFYMLEHLDGNPEDTDDRGWTASHHACFSERFAMVKFLHSRNGDLMKERTKCNQTVLHLALLHRDSSKDGAMLRWLVEESGVDVLATDEDGLSAFLLALSQRNWQAADYLLSLDTSNIYCKDKQGKTALHFATIGGNSEFVQKLINMGADLRSRDEDGLNAFHHACSNKIFEVAKYLHNLDGTLSQLKTKNGENCLHLALKQTWGFCDFEMVRWLVQDVGVEVQAADKDGLTALHVACGRDKLETVKFLLLQDGVDLRTTDANGWNVLHFAAKKGDLKLVEFLLKSDAGLLSEIPLPLPVEKLSFDEKIRDILSKREVA